MTTSIKTNQFRNPYNGSQYTSAKYPAVGYKVYNNFRNGAKYMPNAPTRAGDVAGTVSAVPADLSTLLVPSPDGQTIPFQFVYAGSTPTAGFITIPLVAGGGSVTQAKQAIVDAINAQSGVPSGGTRRYYYPLTAAALGVGAFTLSYTIGGTIPAFAGTQTGTAFVISQDNGFAPVSPGRVGMMAVAIPGALAS